MRDAADLSRPAAAVTPAQVRLALLARREIALIDLREENPFAKAHPLFAACLPLSRLEVEVLDRIPRKDAPVVVYDDGEGYVGPAIERLGMLGYSDVRELAGGLAGWRSAGYELFQDVNSYSKAFGELVDARRRTPSIAAEELDERIKGGADQVVLDARRWDEYRTMSIPTGVSVPGAELVLRAPDLAPDPTTTIVVNCAGRTRSIIGAQSLINAGVPNPVVALRNGAIGWTLAGQSLEHGQSRRFRDEPGHLEEAKVRARNVAYRAGVLHITPAELAELEQDRTRTLYRFDVRTPEEYERGRLAGFRSAPGGQLVQETDMFAPVRGARIVLADDLGARADMTASWLAQMGWEVLVLDGGFDAPLETGAWRPQLSPFLPDAPAITAEALAREIAWGDVAVVDVSPSPAHRKGHVPGAWFAIRSRLRAALDVVGDARLSVFTCPDGALSRLAAHDAAALAPGRAVAALDGGLAAWAATGRPIETGLRREASTPDDVYRRPYEGADHAAAAKQAYLDWEFGLVDQLERDGAHGFFVI
jgi:rhodanese-related sulfurtransferase